MATKIFPSDIDSTQTFTTSGQLLGDGTVSAPSLAFTSNSNTGIYKSATNRLSISTNGAEQFRVDATNGIEWITGQLTGASGTFATPAYAFNAETTLGFWRIGSGNIGMAGSILTVQNDNAQLQFIRSSNGRSPYVQVLNGQGGLRLHGANNGAGETTTIAYQVECDSPTAGSIVQQILANGQVLHVDGTASLPSLSFINTPSTGFYSLGGNRIGVTIAGTQTWAFTAGGDFGTVATGKLLAGDGSAASPGYQFNADADTGVYRVGSNNLGLAAGGTLYLQVGTTGAAGAIDSPAVGGFSNTINSPGNAAVMYTINNDTTNGLSHSAFIARTNGANSGDAYINWNISGATNWVMGIDNSDSDALVITEGASLGGANNRFRMPTGGQLQMSDGSAAAPQFSFISDTSTGMYRSGTSQIAFALAGVKRLDMNGTAMTWKNAGSHAYIYVDRANTSSEGVVIFSTNGTNSAGIGLDNDSTENLALFTNNDLGTPKVIIDTAGQTRISDGSATSPGISFRSQTNLGMYRSAANELSFAISGTQQAYFNSLGFTIVPITRFADGTSSSPGLQFANESGTGLYRQTTSVLSVSLGGAAKYSFLAGDFRPTTDGSQNLGAGSARFNTVFATNSTINTSHSTTKTNIVEIDPTQVAIPEGVFFDRGGRRYVGYLNDILPIEARPIENGEVLSTMNYENAVVGILCAHVRKLEDELAALKQKLAV